MGNFFQLPGRGIGGNPSNTDFDSFLGNRESKNQAEDALAEQRAAKNRKKPNEVALATPITQQEAPVQEFKKTETPLSDAQALESKPAVDFDGELPAKISPVETNRTDSDDGSNEATEDQHIDKPIQITDEVALDLQGAETLEETDNQSQIEIPQGEKNLPKEEIGLKKEIETQSESRGMESAPMAEEMIATATMESAESPAQPLGDPSITTINRLTAFASLERTAVAPVAGSETTSDSGLGNAGGGMGAPTLAGKLQPTSASAQAAGLLKSLAPELDKFKQTGRSQIQLDLPVGENESVRIKLSLRGAEIRSTFITESPELREALQKAWPEFSQSSRDRGFRLGDPSFQQGYADNNTDFGQNNHRRANSETREPENAFATATPRKPLRNATTETHPTSTALWA